MNAALTGLVTYREAIINTNELPDALVKAENTIQSMLGLVLTQFHGGVLHADGAWLFGYDSDGPRLDSPEQLGPVEADGGW